jgi:chemotaxis response regulator CheB
MRDVTKAPGRQVPQAGRRRLIGVVRVVIVGVEERARAALRRLVLGSNAAVVLGEARDGIEAAALAARDGPQVVVMDADVIGREGPDVLRWLRASPDLNVLVVSLLPADLEALADS